MIGYVMVGTNNLIDAIKFYDEVLKVIGLDRNETIEDDYAAYGAKGTKDIEFYVTKPFNKKDASFGNGTQITFLTKSRSHVDKFHEVGLKSGGTSEGSGGERPEGSGVYYSYLRDLDGNKICAFTNSRE